MCGRFIVSYTYEELLKFLHNSYQIEELDLDYAPRYNIAPGQPLLTVIKSKDQYKVGYIDWGLIPAFAKDETTKYKMINARSETIDVRVSYKDSFASKRCLILTNGYYEWNNKRPYVFEKIDKSMFGFAGIWSVNKIIHNRPIYTTSILTKEADELMEDIHSRMPVVFDLEEAIKWLDDKTSKEDLFTLIETSVHKDFTRYEVSNYVNNVRNEGIGCVTPVEKLDI